ncbi:MAG: hypothetical protein MJZ90_06165 [Bacteroidales bacterium]|nr:hypothetical protein [Bacteroidales bacterium]
MTNNSGKFEEVLSYMAADQNNENDGGSTPPLQDGEGGGNAGIDGLIPPCPCGCCTRPDIEYYFGRLWWLWAVALLAYIIRK